jgi:hypothetical protein
LAGAFRIEHDQIITPVDGSITFWGLADKNVESRSSFAESRKLKRSPRGRCNNSGIEKLREREAKQSR